MRLPGPFPEHLRGRPFTPAEAAAAGVSGSRLRSRDIERMAYGRYRWVDLGVKSADALPDELTRLRDLTALYPDVLVTGESVARLRGWPLPDDVAGRLRPTVLRARSRRVLPAEDVVTRLVDLDRVVVRRDRWRGLRCVSHADAWFHLATVLERDALVAVGDRLVRHRPHRGEAPLATHRSLEECLARHAGEAGVVRAREALALVREGADSPAETELRLALIAAGLPEPDLQIALWDREYSTRHPASADLGYRRWKIAVQYEGRTHDGGTQVGKDTRRDAVFLRQGWLVIRAAGTDRARGFRETVALVRQGMAQRSHLEGTEDHRRR